MEKSYLRSGQVAKLFGVKRRTVTGWAEQAKLHPLHPIDISPIGAHYRFSRQEIAGMTLVPESWLPSMPLSGTSVNIAINLGDVVNGLFEWLKENRGEGFCISDKLKFEVYQELKEQVVLMPLPQDIVMKNFKLSERTKKLRKAISAISLKVEQLLKEEIDKLM